MAYVQLEDDTGSMELLCFQRALDSGGGYIADNAALLVRGRISVRDEKEPQLVADSIRPISDAADLRGDYARPRRLWLRLPTADSRLLRRIELLQRCSPRRADDSLHRRQRPRLGANCVIMDSLVRELEELLGRENVKIVTPR